MLHLPNKLHRLSQPGFTLTEVLLTLAIIIVVAGFSIPVYLQLKPQNDLSTTAMIVARNLRRAQTLAMSGERDDRWGVILEPGTVTLFALDAYGDRVTAYDEETATPDNILFTGLTTVVFTKITGEPTTVGSVELSTSDHDVSQTITINQKGLVGL